MAELDYFRVTSNGVHAIGIDRADDADENPDPQIIYAFVTFTPRLPPGKIIWAPTLTPPRGIHLDPIEARFSPEDGKLRTIAAQPQNEKQIVTVTGTPFTLTFDGQTTTNLANTATQLQVETALRALPNIGTEGNHLYVTGDPGGPYNVFFVGKYAGTDVPQMTATNATITTGTPGQGNEGVLLVANTPTLNLGQELIYDVTFQIPQSDRTLTPFAITAPTTTGVILTLETAPKLPHINT